MRNLYTLLLLLCSSSLLAQTDSGLVAHWRFSGDLTDATGKGHNGSLFSTHQFNPYYTPGIGGINDSAILLNPPIMGVTNSGLIKVPFQPDIELNKYSICATVKPYQYNQLFSAVWCSQTILSRYQSPTTYNGIYGLMLSRAAYDSCMTVDTTFGFFGMGIYSYTYAPWQYTPHSVSEQWYRVVLTFDSLQYKLYVNDSLKVTYPVSGYLFGQPGTDLVIGGNFSYSPMISQTNMHSFFRGTIDDIKLYNRMLDSTEVITYGSSLTDTLVFISQPYNDTMLCWGSTYNIPFETQHSFNTGNIFTVQLSDSNGSFTNATTIGSVGGTSAGNINVTIPTNTPVAKGYRIRIVSSSPVRHSYDNGVDISIGDVKPSKPIVSTNTPVCTGQSIILTAGSGPGNVSYEWSRTHNIYGLTYVVGTNQSYIDNNVNLADSGWYSVRASLNGCASDTTAINVVVNQTYFTSLNKNKHYNVCLHDTLTIPVLYPNAQLTYSWYNYNGVLLDTGSTGNIYIDNTFMQYNFLYVVGITNAGCYSADTFTNLTIFFPQQPSVNISVTPFSVIDSGETADFYVTVLPGGNNIFYQWQKNGVDIPGATSYTYSTSNISTGDIFRLKFINKDSCVHPDTVFSNSITMTVIQPSGIEQIDKGHNLTLYPNPNNGSFTISGYYPGNNPLTIEVINALGQRVHTEQVSTTRERLNKTIEPEGRLAAGVYTLKVREGSNTEILKFTVQDR